MVQNLPFDFQFGTVATDLFFRFFSDDDGDRDTDSEDLIAFGATFRLQSHDPGFDPAFDWESDGDVDSDDLTEFSRRFRSTLPF